MAKTKIQKPRKPHPDFPLTPHATKRWCKKIGGKLYYFGTWSNPDEALREYLAIKDELQAGFDPRIHAEEITLDRLCNEYLHNLKMRFDAGEVGRWTWRDRKKVAADVLEILGRNKVVKQIRPADFARLKNQLSLKHGPTQLKIVISRVKSIFKWGWESELLETAVRFGPDFKPPSAKAIRQAKQANGKKLFEADELRMVLNGKTLEDGTQIPGANPITRAMVLLALNAGLGNTDISELPISAIDLETAWLDFPRPKTAIERRCPLWPETVDALKVAIRERPQPKHADDDRLIFLTIFGERWVRMKLKDSGSGASTTETPIDNVSRQFGKLLNNLGLKQRNRNFYSLRHTFRTVADETRDQPAIDSIMGHSPRSDDMAAVYREAISDERLRAVTEHVRGWLFGVEES